jgi:hypothetical protein
MSENIRQFIDQLAAGQAAEAKDTLENDLAARSFAALDEYKKEIAQSIFGGNQETEEETSEEELLTQEEIEQIDELSKATIKSYHQKVTGIKRKNGGNIEDNMYHHSMAADDAHDAGNKSLARYHDRKFKHLDSVYTGKRSDGIDRAEKRLGINTPEWKPKK